MYRFGENIGIIYQITDDYHDLINSIQTQSPIGDLVLGIPTLPITRLERYPECIEAVEEFKEGNGAEKLLKCATPEMAQDTFEELIGPWIEKARSDMAEMPENNYSEIPCPRTDKPRFPGGDRTAAFTTQPGGCRLASNRSKIIQTGYLSPLIKRFSEHLLTIEGGNKRPVLAPWSKSSTALKPKTKKNSRFGDYILAI